MNIIQRIFGQKPQAQLPPNQGEKGGLRRTWSQAPKPETQRLPQLFHQTPRLDPVELIASTIAGSPFELFDKVQYRKDAENSEPVFDHPFYDLVENPSRMFPEMDGYALKYITAVLVELLGECFWVKFRDGNKITEILPFPPSWCTLTPTSANPVFMFLPFGTTAQKTFTVAPEDVVWFKQPDLTDPYGRGRGRTEAVGDELDTDELAAKWQKNYFYNEATPPIWVNLPGADNDSISRMKETWGQKLGGWLNARKPAFTNSEGITITKLGDSNREMDFVESRKYMRDTFLQHYAIPPEMMGILESSNRSTIDSAYYLFAKNVIQKRLGFYERAITRQLIAPDYDARLICKFKFDIPEDEAFKLQKVNEGLARGALTRADWKKAMGYKVEPSDEVYLMPFSILEVPKGKTVQEMKPEAPAITITEGKSVKHETAKSLHWKAADKTATQGEGAFRSRIRAFSDVQNERVQKAVDPKDVNGSIDRAFVGADKALMHALAPAWIASMTDGAELGKKYMGKKVSPSFTLYQKKFDLWIKDYGLDLAKGINETTNTLLKESIKAAIAAEMEEGPSIRNISKAIEKACDGIYSDMSTRRADVIARTETMRSINYGQITVYKEEGVEKKEWLATLDDETRDSHAAMNGKIVGIDETFDLEAFDKVPADSVDAPCNGEVAGQNIQCRCTVLPVVKL